MFCVITTCVRGIIISTLIWNWNISTERKKVSGCPEARQGDSKRNPWKTKSEEHENSRRHRQWEPLILIKVALWEIVMIKKEKSHIKHKSDEQLRKQYKVIIVKAFSSAFKVNNSHRCCAVLKLITLLLLPHRWPFKRFLQLKRFKSSHMRDEVEVQFKFGGHKNLTNYLISDVDFC